MHEVLSLAKEFKLKELREIARCQMMEDKTEMKMDNEVCVVEQDLKEPDDSEEDSKVLEILDKIIEQDSKELEILKELNEELKPIEDEEKAIEEQEQEDHDDVPEEDVEENSKVLQIIEKVNQQNSKKLEKPEELKPLEDEATAEEHDDDICDDQNELESNILSKSIRSMLSHFKAENTELVTDLSKQDDVSEVDEDEQINWDDVVEATQEFHEKSRNFESESDDQFIFDEGSGEHFERSTAISDNGSEKESSLVYDPETGHFLEISEMEERERERNNGWVEFDLNREYEEVEAAKDESLEDFEFEENKVEEELDLVKVPEESAFDKFLKSMPATGINKGLFDILSKDKHESEEEHLCKIQRVQEELMRQMDEDKSKVREDFLANYKIRMSVLNKFFAGK